MRGFWVIVLFAVVLVRQEKQVLISAFSPLLQRHHRIGNHQKQSLIDLYMSSTGMKRGRKPSKVIDEDGPTPDLPQVDVAEVDPSDIPELREIDSYSQMPPGPIPHQPWRRGETDGCEDPITADWRVQAEDIMTKAATLVGGKVIDITWYLTQVVVTLDEDLSAASDLFKSSGPIVEVKQAGDPLYYDPLDPNPEEIWADEDEIVYQRETDEEIKERREKKKTMYATKDESDPKDEPHIPEEEDDTDDIPLYMNEETRDDVAYTEALETEARYDEEPTKPPVGFEEVRGADAQVEQVPYIQITDTRALSTIAGAMIDALEDVEPELRILSRHELVLTSPGPPGLLETQKQFNAHRGQPVIVETQDPWQSNRVLKGRLLDRNSMDVLINKRGRMVTIPLNFVKCVRISASSKTDQDEIRGYEEESEEDDDEYDEEDDMEYEEYEEE